MGHTRSRTVSVQDGKRAQGTGIRKLKVVSVVNVGFTYVLQPHRGRFDSCIGSGRPRTWFDVLRLNVDQMAQYLLAVNAE
jgi:hypothetical protein